MKEQKIKKERKKEVEEYWKSLSLPQKVQALKDQGHTLPHSVTFEDKEVAYLVGL